MWIFFCRYYEIFTLPGKDFNAWLASIGLEQFTDCLASENMSIRLAVARIIQTILKKIIEFQDILFNSPKSKSYNPLEKKSIYAQFKGFNLFYKFCIGIVNYFFYYYRFNKVDAALFIDRRQLLSTAL